MLPLYRLSKCNIKLPNQILFQWIKISMRLSSTSSSDSSDSSDSDSDTEKTKPKKRKLQKTVEVAMQPKKKKSEHKLKSDKDIPFENKIINAAKDVAEQFGGDKTKTTSDLLDKVLTSRVKALKAEQVKIQKNIESEELPKQNIQNHQNKYSKKKSIIQSLLNEYNKQPVKVKDSVSKQLLNSPEAHEKQLQYTAKEKPIDQYIKQPAEIVENSISRQLLNSAKISEKQLQYTDKEQPLNEYNKQEVKKVVENSISRQLLNKAKSFQIYNTNEKTGRGRLEYIDLWNGKPSPIFENMNAASSNIPELKTWTALEQRELKALITNPPANVFQELILWTEQGKLWKFPIDNEQGMEEEQNVHFSEHVFMERHLKGWCPDLGPIRHFMELVCVGLSKNPYLTVQEKIQHIMWYKEYFKSKQDLLQEIGAIQEPFPDKVKEITE
ncbi:hypothetical protein PUN28_004586 [Cardiocondyla obscurior]|uniref:Small ribosomal subunit protein mS31 n=1 Tax=Cardiocondyla obscurior TaxID=286306 RepID=A0AAW2GE51_9HYME